MKKILFISAAAIIAASLVSCNKESHSTQTPVLNGKASVSLSLKANATRAADTEAGTEDENKVNTVDCWIFNSDGTLDAYGHYTATSCELSATAGAGKHIYAVVNAPDSYNVSSILTRAEVQALTVKLGENAVGDFQMFGYKTQALVSGDNAISLPVSRAVARVKIDKITRDFVSEALKGQDMKIVDIYMENVVGEVGFNASDEAAGIASFSKYMAGADNTWYNKYASAEGEVSIDETSFKSLIGAGLASPVSLANGSEGAYATSHSFYVMPNDTDVDNATELPSWTKLVIETKLGGKTYYYAIPIIERESYPEGAFSEGILANHTYNIKNLVLTRPGSEDPNTPVSIANANFTIEVQPWVVVPMASEENGDYII